MDKVKVEVTSTVKVNLGPTPTIKLASTYKLSSTLKVKADPILMVKPVHQPVPRATRVKLPPTARTQCRLVFGRQTGSTMPSTIVVTSHSSVSYKG